MSHETSYIGKSKCDGGRKRALGHSYPYLVISREPQNMVWEHIMWELPTQVPMGSLAELAFLGLNLDTKPHYLYKFGRQY